MHLSQIKRILSVVSLNHSHSTIQNIELVKVQLQTKKLDVCESH